MASEEEFYDSLEEDDQRFPFRTPPNTSRLLDGYSNSPSVAPAEDMDRLASAFQQLRLEDPQQSPRTSVRRSKSCTSLASGRKKQRRSKCDSYLEMYHRMKSVGKAVARPSLVNRRRSMDLAPPPTTRTFYEEEASYDPVGPLDLRALPPEDAPQPLRVGSDDGAASSAGRRASSRRAGYVPYSLKDYRALQVPRLGSLGPDREAVRDKWERMRRQRAYGMQASVRNRSKMASAPRPAPAPRPPTPPPPPCEKQQQQPRKPRPRPPAVATKKAPQQTCDLQPLVDRHIKEMRASAIIRQHFKCL